MQPTGISPSLVRFLTTTAPDLMTELFTPGKVLEADVVSVFQDRAVLSFGRGVRLEVALQAPLQEGQRVRVQVQPQEAAPGQQPTPQQAAPQQPAAQPRAGAQPAPGQPVPTQTYSPAQVLQQVAPQAGQAPPAASPQAAPGQPAPAPQPGQAAPPQTQSTPQQGLAPQAGPTQSQPQQALRPGQPQVQSAQRQPADSAAQAARPSAPIVLKVIGQVPPRDAGRVSPTAAPAPAESQAATAARPATAATAAASLRDVAVAGQPAPVANQPPAQQPGMPQVLWLPIPLPDGNQGWAQIHVQEDDSPKARAQKGGPVQQVRIWWETPALGPVQVNLEAAATNLAALFTAAAAESKGALDQGLQELQRRLAEVGFPDARLGCRTAPPGEAVEPARTSGANRLDKRL